MATAIAFAAMLALYVGKTLNERYKAKLPIAIPCELILVVLGTLVSHFARLDARYAVAVVGPIKKGLPPPSLPPFTHVSNLLLPSITIAVVSLCISISMGKMFGRKHGYKVRSNQVRSPVPLYEDGKNVVLQRNCSRMEWPMWSHPAFNATQMLVR